MWASFVAGALTPSRDGFFLLPVASGLPFGSAYLGRPTIPVGMRQRRLKPGIWLAFRFCPSRDIHAARHNHAAPRAG